MTSFVYLSLCAHKANRNAIDAPIEPSEKATLQDAILPSRVNTTLRLRRLLHCDAFHDVTSDFAIPSVVKPRCSRVSVSGQILHVFKRNTLAEQIGDRCDSE